MLAIAAQLIQAVAAIDVLAEIDRAIRVRPRRDVAELQRQQKDAVQNVDERLRKFEPSRITVDGRSAETRGTFRLRPGRLTEVTCAFPVAPGPPRLRAVFFYGE